MKSKICSLLIAVMICSSLTACGGSGGNYSASTMTDDFAVENAMSAADTSYGGFGGDDAYTYDMHEEEVYDSKTPESESESGDLSTGTIDVEKLVYRGNLIISTLDYDKTVEAFTESVSKAGGFIEDQSMYTDSYSYYYDYNSSDELKRTYNATIRVPSSKFNSVFQESSELGNIISQNSNVENISQEYSTVKTSLEIYQAKYKRYLELLETAEDVESMIEIERELTNIEVMLADYKTRLSRMDTDVAYSYINIEIREVFKQSEIVETNTFWNRLTETVKESFEELFSFLESLLFFVIMRWWVILLFAILIFAVIKISKKHKWFDTKDKSPIVLNGMGIGYDASYHHGYNTNGMWDNTNPIPRSTHSVDLNAPTAELDEESLKEDKND